MAADAESALDKLRGLKRRDLERFLASDERVREWLASGVLLSTKEAAEYMGVERPRMWRWEQSGKITAIVKLGATPIYLRSDLDRLREEMNRAAAAA